MKGKITWLDWFRKKIQRKWGKENSDGGIVKEIDFTSQLASWGGEDLLGSQWSMSRQARSTTRLAGVSGDPPP